MSPFGFAMCRERNIKGCLRWVHQGLLFITTSVGSKASSSECQSLRDFLPRPSSRPCGVTLPWVQVPGGDGLSRPEGPPPGNLPHVAFLGQLPLAFG